MVACGAGNDTAVAAADIAVVVDGCGVFDLTSTNDGAKHLLLAKNFVAPLLE